MYADRISYATSPYDACDGADALIIATEWNEFRKPDWTKLKGLLVRPLVFDGRNIFDVDDMLAEGIEYHSIGRGSAVPDTSDPDV